MATVRFELQGRPREITLHAFETAISSVRHILADLEAAITASQGATVEWVVSDLRMGSLAIALESRSEAEAPDVSPQVAQAFVRGLGIIEHEGHTPPYFSEHSMRQARWVVNLIGKEGTTGIVVATVDRTVQLSAEATNSVRQLLKVRGKTFGSVEGRLETISVHGGSKFILYESRTGKGVTCLLGDEQMLDQAYAAIRKRAIAVGLVSANGRGEPMRVQVQSLRPLNDESGLPSLEELGGSDPDFTGEMSTEEYLQSIRGG